MAWFGPAMQIGGGLLGAFMGGRMSPQQKYALAEMQNQVQRSNRFWGTAEAEANKASGYFSPIAGGSRSAAFEAMSPEIGGAMQRMNAGRQSLLNMTPRSGGAAAMANPYAQADVATNILMKARPGAAGQMADLARMRGGWAAQQGQAAQSLFDSARLAQQDRAGAGYGFFNVLSQHLPGLIEGIKSGGLFGSKIPGGGTKNPTGQPSQWPG